MILDLYLEKKLERNESFLGRFIWKCARNYRCEAAMAYARLGSRRGLFKNWYLRKSGVLNTYGMEKKKILGFRFFKINRKVWYRKRGCRWWYWLEYKLKLFNFRLWFNVLFGKKKSYYVV